MLNKLLVHQTKSRPRHSNDNGLAESKNGWVIRKHIGYGHIASAHAEAFDEFYRQHFNPYLNFHRPCGVPEVTVTAQGKQKRVYRWYATPWEILRQSPGLAGFLRAELTVDQLQQTAGEIRHPGRDGNARSEAQVIRPLAAQEECVNETGEDRGNDGRVENEENRTQDRIIGCEPAIAGEQPTPLVFVSNRASAPAGLAVTSG
jgi:hypothetical protein